MIAAHSQRLFYLLVVWCVSVSCQTIPAAEYQPAEPITGSLTIIGSDTMAELLRAWSGQLAKHHPDLRIQLHAAGSGTAPPALIRGTTNVGAMSRPMTPIESQEFIAAYGYPPIELTVALDAIAIIVNRDNPLNQLSLPQVAAIFAATPACSAPVTAITNWSTLFDAHSITTLDKQQPLAGRSIQKFGRNAASGTYAWFREHTLCGSDYLASVNGLSGNGAIVTAIQQTTNGIGYIGVAFLTAGVKALALASSDAAAITTSLENIGSGRYPLTRRLYLYVNRPTGRRFIPEIQELLQLIYSSNGQRTVNRVGLVGLSDELIQQAVETIH